MRLYGPGLLKEIGPNLGLPALVDIVISRDDEQAFHGDVEMFEDSLEPGCNLTVLIRLTRLRHVASKEDQIDAPFRTELIEGMAKVFLKYLDSRRSVLFAGAVLLEIRQMQDAKADSACGGGCHSCAPCRMPDKRNS